MSLYYARLSKELQAAARALGLGLESLEVRGPTDIEAAFRAARERAGAVVVVQDVVILANVRRIVDLSGKYQLPAIHGHEAFTRAGGLMSYAANSSDLSRRAAVYVDKILKGAKPADLPVEQPTKFKLVVNTKTAKALGLAIPPSLLLRADQVIE